MQEEEKPIESPEENEQEGAGDSIISNPILVPSEEMLIDNQLAEAEQKLAEMQDAFLRAKAEVDNTQRRAQEDIAKAHKFAIEGFAESLLAVKDSLEMALKVEAISVESLREGVTATLRQLTSVFEKNKLFEIDPEIGEKLDPMKHQAISTVPADQESNTIVTVLQKGYTLSDRLLRPAIVIVAAAKSS